MATPEATVALEAFLRDLALAWRNLATYPPGHPALLGSVERAFAQLRPLLAMTGELRLGVVPGALAWVETKLESMPAQRLSEVLHRRHVAVLSFREGITLKELGGFLRLLPGEPKNPGQSRLDLELLEEGILGVRAEPIDYSALRVADEEDELHEIEHRGESLEERIIQELLEGRHLALDESEGEDLAARSARREMERIVERLLAALAAAQQLRAGGQTGEGAGSAPGAAAFASRATLAEALARMVRGSLADRTDPSRGDSLAQLAALLRALPADLRSPVLEAAIAALAGLDGDAEALRQLAASLPPAEVLRAFRQLAQQKFRFSPLALRVAQALAAAAQEEARARERHADARSLAAALRSLFADEDVDRFGSGGKEPAPNVTLPKVVQPASPPPDLGGLRESLEPEALDRQLTLTLLDLLESPLARSEGIEPVLGQLQRLFRQALEDGRPRAATEILERLQALAASALLDEASRSAIRRSIERLASRESVLSLVGALASMTESALAQSMNLVVLLGGPAIRHLLAALVEERDRSRRHQLLEFLCSIGHPIAPEAIALLADSRWFAVRNALVILRRIEDRTSLPAVRKCAEHADIRVRVEAIRNLFSFDSEMPRQLLEQALRDPDPKLADSAITLAARRGFHEAVEPLVDLLRPWDPFGRRRALRLRAWWALGQIGDARALDALRRFFSPGLFKLDSLEERRAAFKALAAFEPRDRAPWVERGMRIRDPQIRAMCQRLAADPAVRDEPHPEDLGHE